MIKSHMLKIIITIRAEDNFDFITPISIPVYWDYAIQIQIRIRIPWLADLIFFTWQNCDDNNGDLGEYFAHFSLLNDLKNKLNVSVVVHWVCGARFNMNISNNIP